MEALLNYLAGAEITTTYEMDTQDYNYGSAEGERPTKPQLRKYVSVFRIDGEPIIPPLMTSEKRRQMQKLKEKALKVEQRLKERQRLQSNKENCDLSEERLSETSRSSLANTAGNISHRSQDYYDVKLKESEESMSILQDLIRRQSVEDETMERQSTSFCSENFSPRSCNEKLKNLQKSETIIYDNSTNEVIKQPQNSGEDQRAQWELLERHQNLNYLQPKKPSHLPLAAWGDGQSISIPSICINPPTPMLVNRQICEDSSIITNKDRFLESENPDTAPNLPNDLSSDESFNSMFTHSDDRPPPVPPRKNGIPRSGKIHDLKAYDNASNVSSKIQQFEAINSEHSTPVTTPNSSPVKSGARVSKLGPHAAAMSRSATSPSIKLSTCATRPQTTPDSSQNSPDNAIVRSSSFTLEGPSKALIDHMRQQRCISERPSSSGVIKNVAPISPMNLTRKISSPSRVHRDTIESKAKRVQKVELKPSRQKIQQKTSQQKLAQAAAASMSPYKCSSPSFSTSSSASNLYKSKKSPYDTANSYTRSSQPVSGKNSTKTSASQLKKSPPSLPTPMSSQRTNKTKCSATAPNNASSVSVHKPPTPEREALTQMDKIQKDKFLRLLKQQEEEQKKLKQAFEMQQKLLIEQLNKEMAATQLNSPPLHPSSMTASRAASALTQRSCLSPDVDQSQSNLEYTQQSLSISNDSSLNSVATITQNTSIYTQVPSLAISNLSSMDHSNANTSLESGSIHACDQSTHRPESALSTTTTPIENGPLTMASGGINSASRRRLFPQEHKKSSITPQDVSMRPLSTRSSSNNRLSETLQKQSPNANKAYVGCTNVAGNRRPINLEVANAAATTINAYVRGFLVRRLFQTEQVQRIVRTMRDTLIFVLNLHIETCQNPAEANTAANIKLKARLLQQLSSASRTLHLIFFQTSVKERMDIIARDRKRIKTKLLAINRKRYIR